MFAKTKVFLYQRHIEKKLSGFKEMQKNNLIKGKKKKIIDNQLTFTLIRISCCSPGPRLVIEKRQTLITINSSSVMFTFAH